MISGLSVVVVGAVLLLLMNWSNWSLTLLPNLLTVEVTCDDHWASFSLALDRGVE